MLLPCTALRLAVLTLALAPVGHKINSAFILTISQNYNSALTQANTLYIEAVYVLQHVVLESNF